MTLPCFDAQLTSRTPTAPFIAALRDACETWGAFYLMSSTLLERQAGMLLSAREFFALPETDKQRLAIAGSPHFRGYSWVRSEFDEREQLHFGPEAPPGDARAAPWEQLRGPNQWPSGLGAAWRTTLLEYMCAMAEVGAQVLANIARAFDLSVQRVQQLLEPNPYLLMKVMRYAGSTTQCRTGMAAHCDWSLITLLLQAGDGLQIRTPDGRWVNAPPRPNSVLVTLGELLQVLSGGLVQATPHRVLQGSEPRTSVPVFINPDLDRVVAPLREHRPRLDSLPEQHVHRVLPANAPANSFTFGDSEWSRKGKGQWCHRRQCFEVN